MALQSDNPPLEVQCKSGTGLAPLEYEKLALLHAETQPPIRIAIWR
jgi:hypothetical protein